MDFTEQEAKAKIGKRVRVRDNLDNSFFGDGVVKGATGKVFDVKPSPLISGAGAENVANPNREIWVVSVQFGNQARTIVDLVGKEEYERDLEEI